MNKILLIEDNAEIQGGMFVLIGRKRKKYF